MIDAQDLADRYVAVWNETDADRRREMIANLWPEDGVHFVRTLEARGYAALETRVKGSHDKNVGEAGQVFRAARNAELLRGVVKFNWEMLPAAGGAVTAVGLEVLVVGDDDRIREDYQFIEPV